MSDPFESLVPPGGTVPVVPPTSDGPSMELVPQLRKAEAHHPHLAVPHERFLPYLQRCLLPPDAPPSIDALRIEDLYLACAYGLGIEAAQVQVEAEHFARIKRRLERMQIAPPLIADVLQELRCRLVEMQSPGFSGRAYAGRGSLGGWLFIAAIRIAERRTARGRQELFDPGRRLTGSTSDQLLPALDPEMEHLVHSCKAAFEAALQQGLAALSCRERNILRYHFFEQLSIDRLAEVYQVHRATAARWIVRAQRHLAKETHARFTAQIPVPADSVPRLIALIRSRLNLSLSALLARSTEPEA